MEVRSTVWCTNCGGNFIATLDMSLDGNHEITCPLCGHIHYRVVRNGEVTEERYASSGGNIIIATTSTITNVSITYFNTYNTASTSAIGAAWLNRSDLTV